jgi:uncharacterized protein (UPF0548 family)
VFRLKRPSAAAITREIDAAKHSGHFADQFLHLAGSVESSQLPVLFSRDYSSSELGEGAAVFAAARSAFERWEMFDLGWVRVVNPEVRIRRDGVVGVEVRSMGLWSLNFSRIVEVVDTATNFGFVYATTQFHVEDGLERFLLEFNEASGAVTYTLEAVSRPRAVLARLGFPVARAFQHRFARDSHRRMKEALATVR